MDRKRLRDEHRERLERDLWLRIGQMALPEWVTTREQALAFLRRGPGHPHTPAGLCALAQGLGAIRPRLESDADATRLRLHYDGGVDPEVLQDAVDRHTAAGFRVQVCMADDARLGEFLIAERAADRWRAWAKIMGGQAVFVEAVMATMAVVMLVLGIGWAFPLNGAVLWIFGLTLRIQERRCERQAELWGARAERFESAY